MSAVRSRRPHGFTMIELMLVISIIGVLFSLAIPVFQTFVIRTKMSERNMVISGIAKSILEETSRRGVLPNGATSMVTGWNPNRPPGSDQQSWEPNLPMWKDISFTPERRLRFRYQVTADMTATPPYLTIIARADLDNNGVPAEFEQTYLLNTSGVWDPQPPVELPTAAER